VISNKSHVVKEKYFVIPKKTTWRRELDAKCASDKVDEDKPQVKCASDLVTEFPQQNSTGLRRQRSELQPKYLEKTP